MIDSIATATIMFSLCLGALMLMRESGYEFDLRKRARRRMLGGRRVSDRA
jgi:hypothetical protein